MVIIMSTDRILDLAQALVNGWEVTVPKMTFAEWGRLSVVLRGMMAAESR